jgi:tRNA (guanine-N7-)-methyltransferase
MTQRTIPIESPHFIDLDALQNGIDWTREFGNRQPLSLEIGCGTGHFIIDLAKRQPESNFLAIDIYNKGCLKTSRKVDAEQLTNVRVIRAEARYLITQSLRPGGLSAIYINCPDPWPKKRHRQRRLVNQQFLQAAWHYLTPGGDFYFSSDFVDYAEEVAELLAQLPGYKNQLSAPLVTDLPGYPESKYMRRFKDQGLPIHYIHHRRDPQFAAAEVPCPEFPRGFRTERLKAGNE